MEYRVLWTIPVLPLDQAQKVEAIDTSKSVFIDFDTDHAHVSFTTAPSAPGANDGVVIEGDIPLTGANMCGGALNGVGGATYTFSAFISGNNASGAICGYNQNTQDSGGQWGGGGK